MADKIDLRDRTRDFALRIIRLCKALPKTAEGGVIKRQLLRSGTSIGANYSSARRAAAAMLTSQQSWASRWKKQMRRCIGWSWWSMPASCRQSRSSPCWTKQTS